MAEKGSGLLAFVVFGNVVIMLCGMALFAETIWATTDPYYIYKTMGVTGKDDVFAGGWIGIFCGFSFFLVGLYGAIAGVKGSRTMLMVYLILMMIVYIFECASCITSFTHRDYMVNSNVVLSYMLSLYGQNTTAQGNEMTFFWNRLMLERSCCGVNGPIDWISYQSTFRNYYVESVAPWPLWCCARDANFQILNEAACRTGLSPYVNNVGCSDHIFHAINSYTWGISWFGFAILMWTNFVMFAAMYHYFTM
ncbi:uroplakin-1a isoform X2 [Hyperolius riggenbachi]|uniref:uroplakin-1a isoform X2 n=1 Tax=Hyperolius riggenbachi TaxID=752182 RepID=UPI0035A33576